MCREVGRPALPCPIQGGDMAHHHLLTQLPDGNLNGIPILDISHRMSRRRVIKIILTEDTSRIRLGETGLTIVGKLIRRTWSLSNFLHQTCAEFVELVG